MVDTLRRSMTSKERATLDASAVVPGNGYWSQAFATFLFMSGMMTALLFVSWSLISWILRTVLDVTWTTWVEPWVVPVAAFCSVSFATAILVGFFRRAGKMNRNLHEDIEGGVVVEYHYEFTEAKRFREPEHGGLIYFLRTRDDTVLVLYDAESQELGAQGKAPSSSRFGVLSNLVLVTAPWSGITLATQFSGVPLKLSAPLDLGLPPASGQRTVSSARSLGVSWKVIFRRRSKVR